MLNAEYKIFLSSSLVITMKEKMSFIFNVIVYYIPTSRELAQFILKMGQELYGPRCEKTCLSGFANNRLRPACALAQSAQRLS